MDDSQLLADYEQALNDRFAYRQRIETENLRDAEKLLCSESIIHWTNTWLWTFAPKDPIGGQSTLPFMLFPKQAELLQWLSDREQAREDCLIEKSRDVGVSWLCCAFAAHRWLFREGFSIGFGSRTLENVDKLGDPKSLFEKLRFVFRHLPAWMMPEGGLQRKESDKLKTIINPVNGSTISGEGGSNIGRGGRTSIYFIDEAAFVERPDLVDQSLEGNTACRVDVSTPNGPGNPFATRRFSGKYPVFTIGWRDDPRKTLEWAEDRKAKVGPVVWASQYEIDYSASIDGICVPAAWVRAAVNLLDAGKITGTMVAGLDVAEMGRDVSVFIPRRGPCVLTPISWEKTNTTETAWRARDHAVAHGVRELVYDVGGVGAGVRGTWTTAEKELPFAVHAINAGESPTDAYWPDGQRSKEKFRNLRAEMWWNLRCRFEKAYEYKEKGIEHPLDEMISIPDHPQMIAELSLPLVERTETGKIQLESKQRMRSRGIKSPNFGDALALAFLPVVDWGTFGEEESEEQRKDRMSSVMHQARAAGLHNLDTSRDDDPFADPDAESDDDFTTGRAYDGSTW